MRSIVSLVSVVAVSALAVGCAAPTSGPPTAIPAESRASTAAPSSVAVAAAAGPALTETFTSTIHGISVSYPEGWVPRAATEPWPAGGIVQQETPFGDVIEDGIRGRHRVHCTCVAAAGRQAAQRVGGRLRAIHGMRPCRTSRRRRRPWCRWSQLSDGAGFGREPGLPHLALSHRRSRLVPGDPGHGEARSDGSCRRGALSTRSHSLPVCRDGT